MSRLAVALLTLAAAGAFIIPTNANFLDDWVEEAAQSMWHDPKSPSVMDWFWFDVLPSIAGQSPSNENGTKDAYREYLLKDKSNDEASHFTAVSCSLEKRNQIPPYTHNTNQKPPLASIDYTLRIQV